MVGKVRAWPRFLLGTRGIEVILDCPVFHSHPTIRGAFPASRMESAVAHHGGARRCLTTRSVFQMYTETPGSVVLCFAGGADLSKGYGTTRGEHHDS